MAQDIKSIISQIAQEGGNDEKKKVESVKVLVFELDNEEFAVYLDNLREIIKIPEITPIPNSPEFISGIFNLRGKIIVALDLEKRFTLKRENSSQLRHIIVSQVGGNDFGIKVDNVKEVLSAPVSAIRPAPELVSTRIDSDYIDGVIVLDTRLIVMLNLEKLLQDKELLKIGKTVKQAIKK